MESDSFVTQVYKVSGSDLDVPDFSRRFAACIAGEARAGMHPIVVHGGGKELTLLLSALQIESRFIDGLRVTDERTRDAALMALCGLANKRLVAALLAAGVDALGVSGVDGGLVRVVKISDALQFVGKPVQIRDALLRNWIRAGTVPVIAPMSIGVDDIIYNVNADHVAGAIAAVIEASMLTFVTNVTGVLDSDGRLLSNLTAGQVDTLIGNGTIRGGMIPKVRTALEAIQSGVRHVRITSLDGVSTGGGTVFSAS